MSAPLGLAHYDGPRGREAMIRTGPANGPVALFALPLFEEANRTRSFAVTILRALADRGINACVDKDFWETVCRRMEAAFSNGEFEAGCLTALEKITAMLATHYPVADASNPNELPDRPALR